MFRAEVYGPLDRGMIVLQLCCWKFSVKDKYSASHHMVIKPFLLLGLAAEYRSRRWMWSTLPTTVRSLWHSLAN